MFATAVSYMGLCVPRLLPSSDEEFGSDGVIGLHPFLILLSILLLLFWAIHLCKDDDDVFGDIDQELVNNFTEGVHLYYSYLQRLEKITLHMEDLTSEVDLDSCSDSQLCFDSCSSRSSSRSHSGTSRSSRSSDRSTCQTCNKRRKRHPHDRFKFLKGGGPDSRCSSGSPSPLVSPPSLLAKPCLKLPGGGDVKDSHHGFTHASCSSSRYVTPSDSPQPLENQPCPRQLTAIGWRINWTLMEAKLDSPVAVPVAAASTVTGCKDRAAGHTDHSRTLTVRHIPMVRQLFEVVPRKGDPAVLCRWHRRHLELNVTQKVARKRWRIAVLIISIVRWLLPERLKGGGTTSSTSTSASTPTTSTQFNTSTTSQAKKGSKITRKIFCPQGANPPSPSQAPCQSPGLEGKPKSIMMYAQGARIPFISQEVREKLESHVCRKQSQRLWGFPKLVTRYVGDLALQQLPTSGSAGNGKIMGNVTDRQAVFSGRAHRNTEFRLKNKTTRPAEEPQATAAVAPDAAAPAAKASSPATRPVEKTTTSTVLQPAETHATKPSQTRHSLNQTSPVRSLTPERCWLEEKVRSKCMEVKLKHFPGMVAQSYHSALASATSQPTRKPTQVAEAPAVVRKRTTPLRQRNKVLFMDQEELRHLEDNLIMKHMEHLQRQGVTTASAPSAHTQGVTTASVPAQRSHSLALETSTHTATVSHPHPALIKHLVLVNGLEGGFGELKTLLAPQQHKVKPSSAAAKVVSGPADSAVSSNPEAQRSSGLPLPPLIRPPSHFISAYFT